MRTVGFGLSWLFVLSCVGGSQPGVFDLGGTPELRLSGMPFEIGCPDGWRYSGYGGSEGFAFFEPPEPLPGGIDSFIAAFWGPTEEMFAGSKVPDAPDAFLGTLKGQYRATEVEEHVGLWNGESALWFRGRIKEESLTSDDTQRLDGFVAAIKSATDGWSVFLIASYPADVYADAFSQTVEGVRPVAESQPINAKVGVPATGECSGSFAEVSPPPYQPIEAFMVTFDRLPTVEVTGKITCKARPPYPQCQFLDAVSTLTAIPGKSYRYRIDIWPTATEEAVAIVRKRLEASPDIASFTIERR